MTLKQYVIQAVAAGAAVAAGSTILTNKIDNARQDQQIEQLQDLDASVKQLSRDLNRVDAHLARLQGMEDERDQTRH